MMKAKYVTPQIEVIELELEGSVMMLSAGSSGGPTTPGIGRSSCPGGMQQGSASMADLEDMISDILQYEE